MSLVPPSPELQILIRQEVREDLSTRDSYLQVIKEWLFQEPHLPDVWDDILLLNFLRGCKFSLEKCKRKLDAYFTLRNAAPELYCNRNFKNPELLNISKILTMPTLPNLTKDGYRVSIIRIEDRNSIGSVEEFMKITLMFHDLKLLLEQYGIAGEVHIVDAEKVSTNHFALVTPNLLSKFFLTIFETLPVNIKQVHVINTHPLVNIIHSCFKPFLKKKIRDRIHFHPDGIESLHKFIPKDILPEEYGGTNGNMQHLHDSWMQKLEEYEPWFAEEENIKVDESKRPGKVTNDYGELFGVEGSFKKLNID